MTDTFFYLVSARWFQLLVAGFTVMTVITVATQWQRWRTVRAQKQLREDLRAVYARELKVIRQQDGVNTDAW